MATIGGRYTDDRQVIAKMPVTVPADFVGFHFRGWPIYNSSLWNSPLNGQPYPAVASPAPTGINFGMWRSHDSGYAFWYQLEPTAGVYNWTNLDTLITTHRQAGRSVVFCGGGTPQFYVSAGDRARTFYDAYGGGGYPASSSPNGLTAWGNFVTALITRYNSAGGAWRMANPTLGKGIQYFETWNEPNFDGNGFFWGTAAQMVDMAYVGYQAVKAVDSTVVCLSPSFFTGNALQAFLTTAGGVNTTKTGKDGCDAIAWHIYNRPAAGTKLDTWNDDFATGLLSPVELDRRQAVCGTNLPIYCTETGWEFNNSSAELTKLAAMPASFRYTDWCRRMMIAAAWGWKCWASYVWDAPYLNWAKDDRDAGPKAINDMHLGLAGKTITAASYVRGGGPVSLTFSDGSTLTV